MVPRWSGRAQQGRREEPCPATAKGRSVAARAGGLIGLPLDTKPQSPSRWHSANKQHGSGVDAASVPNLRRRSSWETDENQSFLYALRNRAC